MLMEFLLTSIHLRCTSYDWLQLVLGACSCNDAALAKRNVPSRSKRNKKGGRSRRRR